MSDDHNKPSPVEPSFWGLKNPTIVIAAAFISILLLVGLVSHRQKNKIRVDNMELPSQRAKKNKPVKKTLKAHIDHNKPAKKKKIKPLLKSLSRLHCGLNGKNYVPICARCNVPFKQVAEVLRCPVCQQEARFTCPGHPQHRMQKWDVKSSRKRHSSLTYICAVCGSHGAPQWDNNGTPRCPYCKNKMEL